jgi:hypothetical protein
MLGVMPYFILRQHPATSALPRLFYMTFRHAREDHSLPLPPFSVGIDNCWQGPLHSHSPLLNHLYLVCCVLATVPAFLQPVWDPCCNLSTRVSTGILRLLVFFFGIGDVVTVEGAIIFRFNVSASSDPRNVAGVMNSIHTS